MSRVNADPSSPTPVSQGSVKKSDEIVVDTSLGNFFRIVDVPDTLYKYEVTFCFNDITGSDSDERPFHPPSSLKRMLMEEIMKRLSGDRLSDGQKGNWRTKLASNGIDTFYSLTDVPNAVKLIFEDAAGGRGVTATFKGPKVIKPNDVQRFSEKSMIQETTQALRVVLLNFAMKDAHSGFELKLGHNYIVKLAEDHGGQGKYVVSIKSGFGWEKNKTNPDFDILGHEELKKFWKLQLATSHEKVMAKVLKPPAKNNQSDLANPEQKPSLKRFQFLVVGDQPEGYMSACHNMMSALCHHKCAKENSSYHFQACEEVTDYQSLKSLLNLPRDWNPANSLLLVLIDAHGSSRLNEVRAKLTRWNDTQDDLNMVILRKDHFVQNMEIWKPKPDKSERVDLSTKDKAALSYAKSVTKKIIHRMVKPSLSIANLEVLGAVKKENTMIVGVSLSHPSDNAAKHYPSIVAMVANAGKGSTKFLGSVRLQKPGMKKTESKQSYSTVPQAADLEGMMLDRLDDWIQENGTLPVSIIYYRHGASEADFASIEFEQKQIVSAFNTKLCGNPKITAIGVTRAQGIRFFKDGSENPGNKADTSPAGTVVDSELIQTSRVKPTGFDFFLKPSNPENSNAMSTHYCVFSDEIRLGRDNIEQLTYELCRTDNQKFMLSCAAPARYAADLSKRGSYYLWGSLSVSPPKSGKNTPGKSQDTVTKPKADTLPPWPTPQGQDKNPWLETLNQKTFWL